MKTHIRILLALVLAATTLATPAADTQPVVTGQRVFVTAHSFHIFVAPRFAVLAKAAGIEGHQLVGAQMIGGSKVIQHWEYPDEKNTATDVYGFLTKIGGDRFAGKVVRALATQFYDQAHYERGVEAYELLLKLEPASPEAGEWMLKIAQGYWRVHPGHDDGVRGRHHHVESENLGEPPSVVIAATTSIGGLESASC